MRAIIVLARQPDSYAVRRLIEAAAQLGAGLTLLDPHQLGLDIATEGPRAFLGRHALDPAEIAVLPRLGSTATEYSLAALDILERMGVPSVNPGRPLLLMRNKFTAQAMLQSAGLPVPESAMLRAPADVSEAAARLGGYPVVLKFIRGSQGVGVIYAPDESVALSVQEAMNLVQYDVLIQRFYPEAAERDLRVLVLGGKARWAVRRQSRGGRFRSNFHRGGQAEPLALEAAVAELAQRAAAVFGLGLAGVDLIESERGLLVMEVNSSPGFETIEAAHANDVAGAIVEYTRSLP